MDLASLFVFPLLLVSSLFFSGLAQTDRNIRLKVRARLLNRFSLRTQFRDLGHKLSFFDVPILWLAGPFTWSRSYNYSSLAQRGSYEYTVYYSSRVRLFLIFTIPFRS
ncbi:hypothetical protein F5B20DRAFT_549840 [Whalleya microplaca]|nr:hypothetical protein F5B20DRAFT_549840 [Whalleya microplaca]